MSLLEWQNLIFLLPMLAALSYVVLMASGMAFGGDMDHDVDLGVEHDLDLDHDVDGGGAHHVPDAMHGHDVPHTHFLGSMLSLLGVGKVPLSILMMSLCFVWGAAGLVCNVLLGTDEMVRVVACAAVAAIMGTGFLAEGLSNVMPKDESYHTRRDELVGCVGEVIYEVTATSGCVRLCDPTGNLVDLDCRTYGDDRIKAGGRALLSEYDPSADVFLVRATVD